VSLPDGVRALLVRHAAFETGTAAALAGARDRGEVRTRRPRLVEALAASPMLDGDTGLAARLVDAILEHAPS
jgi:hypothetical protein